MSAHSVVTINNVTYYDNEKLPPLPTKRRTSSTKVVSAGDRLYMNGFEWTGQEWRRSLRAVLLTGWCE
jgi:hypothetical protein